MSLIGLILVIALVGVVLWFVQTYVPMPAPFKSAINIIAVIVLLFYVLSAFGLLGGVSLPRIR